MKISSDWTDYECLDAGNGEKLERWKNHIIRRPDPQAMWQVKDYTEWKKAQAFYHRSNKGGGYWDKNSNFPNEIIINYKSLKFKVSLTDFKHTGLFPEQATNWDYMIDKIKNEKRPIKVLNLFAYTGGATMACAYAGASVTHVDASKGMKEWAKENAKLCGLENAPIKYIVDDCIKYVEREYRRGNKYDAIIMDPPSYGRGPNGEMWKFEDCLYSLINACMNILSDNPLFFLINSYTTGISSTVLENILKTTILEKYSGKIECGDIGLPIKRDNLKLPCGIYGRWENVSK